MAAVSRRKGANGERAVVNFALIHGVDARRVIRTADQHHPDEGDVHLHDGQVVVQVKVGKKAQGAAGAVLGAWWTDTQAQSRRVGGIPVLVVQARGVPASKPADWDAHLYLADLLPDAGIPPRMRVRIRYADLIQLLTGGTNDQD